VNWEQRKQLLVTANVVRRWMILSTLMMKTVSSSEAQVLTRAIRRRIPEDGNLQREE
jgi:hypothetical protein